MGEKTAPPIIGAVVAEGTSIALAQGAPRIIATTNAAGVGQDFTHDVLRASARKFSAGWNLLETLEEMDALGILDGARKSVETMGWDATSQRLARVEDAIRTALESKP